MERLGGGGGMRGGGGGGGGGGKVWKGRRGGGGCGGFIVGLRVPLKRFFRLAGQEPRRTKGATPMRVYPAPPVGGGRKGTEGGVEFTGTTPRLHFQSPNPKIIRETSTKRPRNGRERCCSNRASKDAAPYSFVGLYVESKSCTPRRKKNHRMRRRTACVNVDQRSGL